MSPAPRGLPGLTAEDLPQADSDFALLEHFGVVAVPADREPNRRPAPAEIPEWTIEETEAERVRRVLGPAQPKRGQR